MDMYISVVVGVLVCRVVLTVSLLQAKSRSEKHAKRNDFVRTKLAQEDVTTGFSPIFDPRYVFCHCG